MKILYSDQIIIPQKNLKQVKYMKCSVRHGHQATNGSDPRETGTLEEIHGCLNLWAEFQSTSQQLGPHSWGGEDEIYGKQKWLVFIGQITSEKGTAQRDPEICRGVSAEYRWVHMYEMIARACRMSHHMAKGSYPLYAHRTRSRYYVHQP